MRTRLVCGAIWLLAFLLSPSFLHAQETATLSVGDDAIDPSRLAPGTQQYRLVRIEDTTETRIGTVEALLEPTTLDDGEAGLLYVLSQQTTRADMTDSLLLRARTLEPVRYRNHAPGFQYIALDYAPDHRVRGVHELKDQPERSIDVQMEAPRFDGTFAGQLARALPLEEGYAARLPVFSYRDGKAFVTVRVVGTEPFQGGDETTDAWLVEIESPGGRTTTHWIAKETRDHLGWRFILGPDVEMRQVRVEGETG